MAGTVAPGTGIWPGDTAGYHPVRCEFSLTEGSASAQATAVPLVWGAYQVLGQDANRSRSVVTSRGLS